MVAFWGLPKAEPLLIPSLGECENGVNREKRECENPDTQKGDHMREGDGGQKGEQIGNGRHGENSNSGPKSVDAAKKSISPHCYLETVLRRSLLIWSISAGFPVNFKP
jgi:hypothetical protein